MIYSINSAHYIFMALTRLCNCLAQSFRFNFAVLNRMQPKYLSYKNFRVFLKMKTVYFHNDTNDDTLLVQVMFQHESPAIVKTFSFQRNMRESIEIFCSRLSNRIEDAISKKLIKLLSKNSSETLTSPKCDVLFLDNETPISTNTLFCEIFGSNVSENLKLRILGCEYKILFNCPLVLQLTLPDKFKVGFPIFPKKFVSKCCDESLCEFSWYIKKDKNWIHCGEGYSYTPKESDVNSIVKLICIPKNSTSVGPQCDVISLNKIEEFNNGIAIKMRQSHTQNTTDEKELRIVSYNILADTYTGTKEAKTVLFNYCKPEIIDFNYRMGLILMELEGYNADIICLQEVDKKFFKFYLLTFLKNLGLYGKYSEKEGSREGCALFYSSKKFKVLSEKEHILFKQLMENPFFDDLKKSVCKNSSLVERITGISTLMQIVVLECSKKSDDLILIGNTHLYFHPNADHIRLLQGIIEFNLLLQESKELKERYPSKNVSIIWCGDFNSTPDCGIYKLMTQGFLDGSEKDWRSCPNEIINGILFSNPLNISSAYGAPQFTNYTESFKECLDYIYYQTDRLQLKSFVPLPSEEMLGKEVAIPSSYFPSDHLALIADFQWKK